MGFSMNSRVVRCLISGLLVTLISLGCGDDEIHPDDLERECSFDEECLAGTVCEDGHCAEFSCDSDECQRNDRGCLITEQNPGGTCSLAECSDDGACDAAEFCSEHGMCDTPREQGESCNSNEACQSNLVCPVEQGSCQPPLEAGESCQRDGVCGEDLLCSPGGVCEQLCFEQVTAGHNTGCVLTCNGRAYCWGANSDGELGADSDETSIGHPTSVYGDHRFAQLSSFNDQTCALDEDGAIWCWGSGHGTAPTRISDIDDAIDLDIGFDNTCAVVDGGDVYCWGSAEAGILGDDVDEYSSTPVHIQGLADVQSVSVGSFHACALVGDGTIRCWGMGEYGRLGDGSEDDSTQPVQVVGIDDADDVLAASQHTCAISTDGTLRCWGRNHAGQLGNGVNTGNTEDDLIFGDGGPYETSPVVPDVDDVVAVAASNWSTCAATLEGYAYCWGSNIDDQLGRETTSVYDSTPGRVEELENAIGVAAGLLHSCAIRDGEIPVCWGTNDYNNLGDGRGGSISGPASASPVEVAW